MRNIMAIQYDPMEFSGEQKSYYCRFSNHKSCKGFVGRGNKSSYSRIGCNCYCHGKPVDPNFYPDSKITEYSKRLNLTNCTYLPLDLGRKVAVDDRKKLREMAKNDPIL